MGFINPERLVHLACAYPALKESWYLVACACLAAVNRPQEIPMVVHFALRQQPLVQAKISLEPAQHYQLACELQKLAQAAHELSVDGREVLDIDLPSSLNHYTRIPHSQLHRVQSVCMSKTREVLLKGAALNGLPKSINGLTILRSVTPSLLLPSCEPLRPSMIAVQDATETSSPNTIDGNIDSESVNKHVIMESLVRGLEFWDTVYTNKINKRVRRQLVNAYPDLWQFAFQHVYSPLLSFTNVLLPRETLLCIVASLIPQDVNPQLKGHLRGALNNGSSIEEMNAVRLLVFDICDWTGSEYWVGGKSSVAKI